ncbi:MAG: CBS domain-containing protein, partial [Saprospiraceae bacterium]
MEEDHVNILSSFVTSVADPENIELTLKVNRHDLARTISSLERHNYVVKQTFGELESADALQERYNSLMHYLNV